MPLGYALVLFAVSGVALLVRGGAVVTTPLGGAALVGAAMVIAALLILRAEAYRLFVPIRGALYGHRGIGWSWRRTAWLALLAPMAVGLPMLCAASVVSFQSYAATFASLSVAVLVQTLLFAVPQALFFREAAVRAFGAAVPLAFLMSALATLVFFLPTGLAGATLAAGSGTAAMALRVAGMNIFGVAVIQGLSTVVFGRVVVAQVDETTLWPYILAFLVGCGLFSALVLTGRRLSRRWPASAPVRVAR